MLRAFRPRILSAGLVALALAAAGCGGSSGTASSSGGSGASGGTTATLNTLIIANAVKVDTLDEAIELVNSSRYGNGSSIFTESGAVARRYRHDCDAGMIGVNIGVAAPVAFFPFSGWKDSFLGDLHAHGGDAIDFYTRKTTVTSRWYSDGETGKFFVE